MNIVDSHTDQSTASFNMRKWPDFSSAELSCRCCGEFYLWPAFLDRLQHARSFSALPFHIYSGHRCSLHNARIGGAPLSQHLRLAVDIAANDRTRGIIYNSCRRAGFLGFGFYQTFLHVDLGRQRNWFGSGKAQEIWQSYLN